MSEQRKRSRKDSAASDRVEAMRLLPELQSRESIVIGRGLECDVVIKDVKASRKHCRLTRAKDGFVLEDLGSRNGTFVNGEKISGSVTLLANQTFKAGDTMFYLAPKGGGS